MLVIQFVVVELVPLRGGNEFGTRPQNKILVPFRGVLEMFWRAPPSLLRGSTPRERAYHSVTVSSVLTKDGKKKVSFYCGQPEVPAILISRLLLDMRGKYVARMNKISKTQSDHARCKLISRVFKHSAQRTKLEQERLHRSPSTNSYSLTFVDCLVVMSIYTFL